MDKILKGQKILYINNGYTSYNLANSGQSIAIIYYVCNTTLKTQSSK